MALHHNQPRATVAHQGVGGGIYIAAGTVSVKKTKISSNHASTGDDDVFGDLIEVG